jgi:hypothetical protein
MIAEDVEAEPSPESAAGAVGAGQVPNIPSWNEVKLTTKLPNIIESTIKKITLIPKQKIHKKWKFTLLTTPLIPTNQEMAKIANGKPGKQALI